MGGGGGGNCIAFFGVNSFIYKVIKRYTHLRCLLNIKVFTQHLKVAGALVAYCSGESSVPDITDNYQLQLRKEMFYLTTHSTHFI